MIQEQTTNESESERTTISIDRRVKKRLESIGRISQSYGELIDELIDYWEKGHRKK
jgi:hypothetical protein